MDYEQHARSSLFLDLQQEPWPPGQCCLLLVEAVPGPRLDGSELWPKTRTGTVQREVDGVLRLRESS